MVTVTHFPAAVASFRAPGGPWDQPTLDALLTSAARRAGDRVLVVDGPTRCTGNQLDAAVGALAGHLVANGVEPGDAVAWQRPNDLGAIVALRACWRIGAIAVPIHHNFSASELATLVTRVEANVVLGTELDSPLTAEAFTGIAVHDLWTDGDAVAAVLFTSGSSGTPKGVVHTQHTLAYKARTMGTAHGLDADDCVLMPAPLAHVSGVLNGVTLPGAVPFTTVLMQRWNPDDALELIEAERVTFMVGPPTFFVSMLQCESFATERVASLRLISSGGAGVTESFVETAAAAFGAVVKRTYGSTEAPTVATSTPDDPTNAARRHDGRAIGVVELGVSDRGELLIRGPEVCGGYLDADTTAAAFDRDGWYHSGDLATIDDDGWLTITGRIADVIIRGGENISSAELEAVLERDPAIAQAVVVGYPDDLMGERVCACVVMTTGADTPTVETVGAWFSAEGVARYKTPERVIVVDSLPTLATGKPDRAALRALAEG